MKAADIRFILGLGWLCLMAGAGLDAQNRDIGKAVPDKAIDGPVTVDASRQAEYRALLTSLDQLIVQGSKESKVFQTYQTVRDQMLGGKLLFIVDGKSSNTNLLQSTYFSPNPKGISWIVADPLLLDRAKTQPDLAMALILNAMVFSEGFFSDNAKFQLVFQDTLQSYLYSMDALYIQALFIRDYLKPHYPKLSDYNQFLSDTLDFENMSGASMFVLGVDQDVVYGLKHFEGQIRDRTLSPVDYLSKVGDMVTEIDTKLSKAIELGRANTKVATKDDTEVSERQRYMAVIATLTMLKYGVGIMNVQMPLFEKVAMEKARTKLDVFNARLDKLSEKVAPLMNGVMGYRQHLLDKLGI